jgi:hypothetical protein
MYMLDINPKIPVTAFEEAKFAMSNITVEKPYIQEDMEWWYLNNNPTKKLHRNVFFGFVLFLISVTLVTPVTLYAFVAEPLIDSI